MILVNTASNWGFAYYWPAGRPATRPDHAVLQGYEAYFPGQPRIIVARDRDPARIAAALAQALARARRDGCGRVWLVRTHLVAAERLAWLAAEHRDRVLPRHVIGGLQVIRPGC